MEKYINNIRENSNILNVINVTREIINNGYVFNSIMNKITQYIIHNKSINDNAKAKILFEISQIEKNINDGADEYIQLLKLLNIISLVL
jgi:predicted SnoaL-like aldol condensation-catalyzing enzyme